MIDIKYLDDCIDNYKNHSIKYLCYRNTKNTDQLCSLIYSNSISITCLLLQTLPLSKVNKLFYLWQQSVPLAQLVRSDGL